MKPAENLALVALRLSRRGFVHRVALASTALSGLVPASAAVGGSGGRVRFGLIAGIHPDVLPDGLARVQAFVKAMTEAKVDFILQLGDFVWPKPSNQPFLEAWNAFPGPRYHVLGNHDLDDGYTREQTVAFVGMPGMHYTFPAGPALGIVLDANEPGGKRAGYRRFVGAAQLAWLDKKLAGSTKPCLLFIHQPFDAENDDAVENAAEVRAVVERAENEGNGVASINYTSCLRDHRMIGKCVMYRRDPTAMMVRATPVAAPDHSNAVSVPRSLSAESWSDRGRIRLISARCSVSVVHCRRMKVRLRSQKAVG